jgi:hypothetical protein
MTEVVAPQQNQIWDPDLYVPGKSIRKTGVTVFLYGLLGTIKTTWAGSWPSPVFLSAGQEGGDDSLESLPELLGIDAPPVYQINSTKMMRDKVNYIAQSYKTYGWKTVVIDSVTFYLDIYMREVIMGYQRAGKDPMMQQRDWGYMENHICKEIAQTLHSTNLNVIWIALAKEKWSRKDRQGDSYVDGVQPMMSGGTATKLPAMCKMVMYADKQLALGSDGQQMVPQPVFRTSPNNMTKDLVRHKYANAFPEGHLVDPEYGSWPTFRAIDSRIGQFIYK